MLSIMANAFWSGLTWRDHIENKTSRDHLETDEIGDR